MSSLKNRIRKIVQEQLEAELKNVEDVKTVEDSWEGGDNLVHDLDHSKISTGESNVDNPEELEIVVAEVRRRIQERMQAHPRGELGRNVADVEFPILVRYDGRSEVLYDADSLDELLDDIGPNTPYSLDSLSDIEAEDVPVGAEIEQYMEGKDQNKDGKNNFEDVKIARMRASGMSDSEIKKKHPELFKESALHRRLRKIIKETVIAEGSMDANKQVFQLLSRDYDVVSDDTRYPYGRYRGDVRQKIVYARKDGQPVPEADINLLKDRDAAVREEGGSMAALAGIYTSKLSDDGMQIIVDYYRHTAG